MPARLVLMASGLLAGWFGLLAWLAHSPPNVPHDWLGLWAGDRKNHPSLLFVAQSWSQTVAHAGVWHPGVPLTQESDPAYRLAPGEGFFLGRWNPRDGHRWTVGVWVRTQEAPAPQGFVPLAGGMIGAVKDPWCWGIHTNGHPSFMLRREGGHIQLTASEALVPEQWTHLMAVYALPELRIYVNGRLATNRSRAGQPLMAREVWLGSRPGIKPAHSGIVLDDFVVFSRALSDREVAAWHETGRGAPMDDFERRQWGERLRRYGTPWVTGFAFLLGVMAIVPWLRLQVFGGLRELLLPPLRAVRWTLFVGAAATCGLTAVAWRSSRQTDRRNFELTAHNFCEALESEIGRAADLLLRARDQLNFRPDLTAQQLQSWLDENHFPHDHPGMQGMGVAMRVESADLDTFERTWTDSTNRPFQVWPRIPDEERPSWRGWPVRPRLPIVMNVVKDWSVPSLADRTQLGRDLVAVRSDEEEEGGQFASIQAIVGAPAMRSSGLVEISGAEFGGVARQGLRIFASFFRKPPGGMPYKGPRDWAGVLFVNLDLQEWMQSYRAGQAGLIGVRLITGAGMGGYDRKEAVVADSGNLVAALGRPLWPYLEHEVKLRVYRRRLWAQFWTTPAFDAQSHRHWPWIALAAGAVVTVLTSGLLAVQVRARLRQERVSDDLRVALDRLNAARREREQLSYDLHDGTIQSLYALQLGLSRASEQAQGSTPALGTRLSEYRHNLVAIIGEVRGFILRHEGESGLSGDLESVLTTLLDRLRPTTETALHADLSKAAAWRLSGEQAVHLANIAREGLSNALRHGNARRITVTLREEPGFVLLEIADDGVGFEVDQAPSGGLGLTSMRSRAREVAGQFQLESHPGRGTRVVVRVPVVTVSPSASV